MVLGNLVRTYNIKDIYIDKYDPWSVILVATAFSILSTKNRLKGCSPGQLVFDCDIILLVKHTLDWELKFQRNQVQINKYDIRKNSKIVDHDYKVRDKFMPNNNASFKYDIPYKGLFDIAQHCSNGMVGLHCVAIKN